MVERPHNITAPDGALLIVLGHDPSGLAHTGAVEQALRRFVPELRVRLSPLAGYASSRQ